MRGKRKTVCGLCGKEIKLTKKVLVNGCPFCGSFKFKSIYEPTEEEEKLEEVEFTVSQELSTTSIEEGIEAIRITRDGVFEIDIEKLMSLQGGLPLIMRNKDGAYFIKIEEAKKEKREDKE